MDDTLTAVSLFAGVGGFDLAAELAGIRVVAAVEIDTNARGVLAHRFPQTHLFDDVRTVTPDALRSAGFIPQRGVILGGFPCQDLSVAGRREGLAGERSGLFWEIIRLIDELAPKWVVLENVPGLLSSNRGRDMGTVVGALERRGYGVAWRVLDASGFGVPQRQRRLFLVCHSGDDGLAPVSVLSEPDRRHRNPEAGHAQGQDTPSEAPRGSDGTSGSDERVVVHHPSPVMGTLTTAFGDKNYSNHQEASQGAVLAYAVTDAVGVLGERAHTLTAEGHDASEDGTGRGNPVVAYAIGFQPTDGGFANYNDNGLSTTMKASDGPAVAYSIREDAKANTSSATEVETARALQAQQPSVQSHHAQTFITQTIPEDERQEETGEEQVVAYNLHSGSKRADRPEGGFYVKETEIARTLDASGGLEPSKNDGGLAITQTIGAETSIWVKARRAQSAEDPETWREDDTAPTLNTFDGGDSRTTVIALGQTPTITGTTIVRRLTPTECERLQGFPDGWTAERLDFKTGHVVEQKDSPRFRQMGNAVAVPCVAWILRRLAATHHALKENP